MRFTPLLMVAGTLAVSSGAALAVDYSRIDCTLIAEPEYRSDMPQYALLLFGPEAELRVWVVLDRDTLYVDRNGDGDLTAADECIGTLTEPSTIPTTHEEIKLGNGGADPQYVISRVSTFEGKWGTVEHRRFLLVYVQTPGRSYRQYAGVDLKDSSATAHMATGLARDPHRASCRWVRGLCSRTGTH